ncbi:MAG: hypothetical protein JNM78_12685 [Cyclobacteriaceae bacterium]|nr:hypothetical protein [Cyclobacteriaceae bacterium]
MGTWGTSIFSDDLAADIRNEFRIKIGFGKSPIEASKELIDEYKDTLNDSEESSIFWIALSAVQWLNEVLCFVSSSVVADSFVLRNHQLLKPTNR